VTQDAIASDGEITLFPAAFCSSPSWNALLLRWAYCRHIGGWAYRLNGGERESWSFADGLRCSPCQPGHLAQVTRHGHPLYLFSHEQLTPLRNGAGGPAGNGNGIKAFGGTLSLVVNP
jgi:hypothetical protein